MAKAKEQAELEPAQAPLMPRAIPLKSVKLHDAISIKTKVSAFWTSEGSHSLPGIKITAYPESALILITADGIDPVLIPFANIPLMTPKGV